MDSLTVLGPEVQNQSVAKFGLFLETLKRTSSPVSLLDSAACWQFLAFFGLYLYLTSLFLHLHMTHLCVLLSHKNICHWI